MNLLQPESRFKYERDGDLTDARPEFIQHGAGARPHLAAPSGPALSRGQTDAPVWRPRTQSAETPSSRSRARRHSCVHPRPSQTRHPWQAALGAWGSGLPSRLLFVAGGEGRGRPSAQLWDALATWGSAGQPRAAYPAGFPFLSFFSFLLGGQRTA